MCVVVLNTLESTKKAKWLKYTQQQEALDTIYVHFHEVKGCYIVPSHCSCHPLDFDIVFHLFSQRYSIFLLTSLKCGFCMASVESSRDNGQRIWSLVLVQSLHKYVCLKHSVSCGRTVITLLLLMMSREAMDLGTSSNAMWWHFTHSGIFLHDLENCLLDHCPNIVIPP